MSLRPSVSSVLRRPVRIGLVLIFTALLLGCEEEVTNPILGTDRSYSIYGNLAPARDTQWVRVYPIVGRLEPTTPEPLGVTLQSTDVTTGTTTVWRDSVFREPDGRYAHVYWSDFQPDHEHTYRLQLSDPDGRRVNASVTVPPPASLVVEPADTIRNRPISTPHNWAEVPVRVDRDVPRLINVRVDYCMEYPTEENILTSAIVTLDYNGAQEKIPGGWEIRIRLHEDQRTLAPILRQTPQYPRLRIHGIQIRLHVVDEGWNPPSEVNAFDPDVIVEPGTMSNVTGGFGFIGSGYRLRTLLDADDDVFERVGYRAVGGCPLPYPSRTRTAARRTSGAPTGSDVPLTPAVDAE